LLNIELLTIETC